MVYWPSAVVVAVRLVPRTTTRASTSGCPAAVTLPVTVAWAWSAAGAAANASNANIACRFLHGFLVRTTDMVILGLSPGGGSRDAGESPASAGREWEGGRGGMARGRNSMRSTRRRLVRVTCRVASRSQRVLVPGIGPGGSMYAPTDERQYQFSEFVFSSRRRLRIARIGRRFAEG